MEKKVLPTVGKLLWLLRNCLIYRLWNVSGHRRTNSTYALLCFVLYIFYIWHIFCISLLHHSRIDLPYSTLILLHFLIRVLFRKLFSHRVVRVDHVLNETTRLLSSCCIMRKIRNSLRYERSSCGKCRFQYSHIEPKNTSLTKFYFYELEFYPNSETASYVLESQRVVNL